MKEVGRTTTPTGGTHMARGKAHGPNREYQVRCRDVLIHRDPELVPYEGDGIDVAFDIAGSSWTLDVALRKPDGSLVVAECRRKTGAVKQEELAAFAYKVERLREQQGVAVAGLFITKTAHQIGAVKAGESEGISMAVLAEDASPPGFSIVFHHYDAARARRITHIAFHVAPGEYRIQPSTATLTKRPASRGND